MRCVRSVHMRCAGDTCARELCVCVRGLYDMYAREVCACESCVCVCVCAHTGDCLIRQTLQDFVMLRFAPSTNHRKFRAVSQF